MTNLIWTLALITMYGYIAGFATTAIWEKNNKFTKYLGYNAILGKEEYKMEDYYD